MKKHKYILLLSAVLMSILGKAQTMAAEPQMADDFRSNGKIYVVISVLSIIFICIITYLIYIDIKLKKIESKK